MIGLIVDGTKAESIGLVNYVTEQSESGDSAYQYALKLGQKINRSVGNLKCYNLFLLNYMLYSV